MCYIMSRWKDVKYLTVILQSNGALWQSSDICINSEAKHLFTEGTSSLSLIICFGDSYPLGYSLTMGLVINRKGCDG